MTAAYADVEDVAVEFSDEIPEQETPVDPAAPFGRKLNGEPKKAPGGRPSGKAGRPGKPRLPGSSTPRRAAPPRRAAAAKPRSTGTDYRPGLRGFLHVVSMPLLYSPATRLDAAAVLVHGEGFVDAINETAKERPEVRDLCERAMKIGPYGLIIESLVTIGAQIVTNHGWLPIELTARLGAVSPEVLAEQLGMHVAAAEAEYAAAQETSGD